MNHFTLFKKILSTGSIVLDIGGHRGGHSVVFAKIIWEKGKVFNFEPHPDLFPHLENVAVHYPTGNVFPFSYAVSNTIGQAVLFSGNEESSDWASTICAEHDTSEHVGLNVRKFMVKTIPVDFFCKELEVEPDFVKIDVEGAEDRVILGMREVLTRYKPTVFFEFGLPEGTAQLPQHFKTLREFGYTLYLSDLTQFLGSPPYSWKEIVDSSNQKLRETIFSFTDVDLLYLRPFHTNVLAIQRTQDLKLLLTDQIMPISEATHLFSPP